MDFKKIVKEKRSIVLMLGLLLIAAILPLVVTKSYIQAISSKIEAYKPSVCVLDFQDVVFMDSSGIAVVINALRGMTKIQGQLMLSGVTDQPMRVLRASGIDKLVQLKEAVS